MSAGVAIFLVIILLRWVLPSVWNFFTQPGAGGAEITRRGKVLGHRGPGPRSFKGRAGRREWWLSTLGNAIVGAIVGAVPVIGTLLSLPWIIATLAVNARRLHDLQLSAWLQLVPMVFGFAAIALFAYMGSPAELPEPSLALTTPAGWLTIAVATATLFYIAFYIWLGFVPGRTGPNVYGEADPI
jgi:uncharacterized membrane protein YhaH (DUF805 family)